jgi:hypothetical protein
VTAVIDFPRGRETVNDAQTRMVGDTKVYIVDEATGVFVFNLLNENQCDDLVRAAEEHVSKISGGDPSKSWRKLYTYTKVSERLPSGWFQSAPPNQPPPPPTP